LAVFAPWVKPDGGLSTGRRYESNAINIEKLQHLSISLGSPGSNAQLRDLAFWRDDGTWILMALSDNGLYRLQLSAAESAELLSFVSAGGTYRLDPDDERPSTEVDAEIDAAVAAFEQKHRSIG
jgi:hypothetical protein